MDFMFPYCRNMFSLDILLNDKTSTECFDEKITVNEIVSNIVSRRFNEHRELNLSNFCEDPVLKEKKIHFYKLNLLSHFKILMIRMGRETKILNLSSNNLSQVPLEILNFFIKGDLIGVNLSNNNIPSVAELQRISSKIEKLWVEGNPLCEEGMDMVTYIRLLAQKFPRLTELDGVPLNEHGVMLPFFKHFVISADSKTKMVIEKFVTLYFAHYDTNRRKLEMFYDIQANLTMCTDFDGKFNFFSQGASINYIKSMVIVISGVYKEISPKHYKERFLHFRRTFVLYIAPKSYNNVLTSYMIVHDMLSVSLATERIIRNSFKNPIRNIMQFTLIDPDPEDIVNMCNIFSYYTQLKAHEAEARLLQHDWDFKKALKQFTVDFKKGNVSSDKFMDDDFSDMSSLLDDEID
ncbi:jg14935 [Pararge aegeria aegeria]|uniref:Jg14935 protein n=1 Tax=Pararge aegeria aegeria TaxID=348720 RepID=A0A8S4QP23_9NEOP|nr:jg14935 [Pararge aegeria aegeria]